MNRIILDVNSSRDCKILDRKTDYNSHKTEFDKADEYFAKHIEKLSK